MNKHFLKAFLKYNWPAILWLALCSIKVWEHTQVPTFDDKGMTLVLALHHLRDMLYGVRWSYVGVLGVVYMFFTYHKVTQSTIENILGKNVNKAHEK